MIERNLSNHLKRSAKKFPVVTLTGPRQSGKSTLCRMVFPNHPHVNLESPDVQSYAQSDPRGFLSQFPKGAILDEFQRCPELPSYLQGIVDEDPKPGRWVLTGSHNLSIIKTVSQSLAGRTAVLRLLPLTYDEVMRFKKYPKSLYEAILSGGYPRIFDKKMTPHEWFQAYVSTYINRDIQAITQVKDLTVFQKYIEHCAGRTAQLLNFSSLANDCGVTQPTAKSWMSILEAGFIAFRLPSYSSNVRKRLVKMPKLHFYDSGLVCWLLGIRSTDQLQNHPLKGAIFETWVVSEILKHRTNKSEHAGLHFYRDSNGVETDLIVEQGKQLDLIEVKAAQTANASLFSSVNRVEGALSKKSKPCKTFVIYGGNDSQTRNKTTLFSWSELHKKSWI